MPAEPLFWVKDCDKSAAFYQRALGFTLDQRFPESGRLSWCSLTLGSSAIMLTLAMSGDGEGHPPALKAFFEATVARCGIPGSSTVYIPVPNVDAHLASAKACGATIVEPIRDTFWGLRQYTVADPEGHWLTFHSPVKTP